MRAAWAFVFRDFHLTRRYWSWVLVFTFYDMVTAASIMLIGVAAHNPRLTLTLLLGAVMWSFLGRLFGEIANSISYERWEGTIEYTFMAPVSRLTHLVGVSLFAGAYALLRGVLVFLFMSLFVDIGASFVQVLECLVVFVVASLGFMGIGLMAAVLPVMSTENGAQATNIIQAVFLLISGVYYPVSVLPAWLQPISALSPATYALNACRKILGVNGTGTVIQPGVTLAGVLPELGILLLFGLVTIPLGLFVFGRAETWAKRTGKLKRAG
ncbi:ABC transporter permease [Deinococcus metallilatus]|uniref:Transport permease protein n=1 Tax=Deinococcus metallilatus TaxID=1211322 RepID=A0AAJ5JX85_9DEIO|nr:ABC transporter permease [Deinococcus metallilatus]RXJ09209.1 ABC transporter permease [Deinococcus metallilatus]TLK22816.1 ABC transporter permease [Deinococcus metallilatus]